MIAKTEAHRPMPLDVPIAIRLLEILSEGVARSFPALRARVGGDTEAPTDDALFDLLDALHRERLVEWTMAQDGAAPVRARLRDARARDESVRYQATDAGRSALEAWKAAARSGGWSIDDRPRA